MNIIDNEIFSLTELCYKNGIQLENDRRDKFSVYLSLLLEWNRRTNLISKNDETRIIERHFFESILLTKLFNYKNIKNILDFGSGAGFPGIPVKIMLPETEMTLIESKRMKALFLSKLIEDLNMKKIHVVPERGESLSQKPEYHNKFDLILSRAVYKLDDLIKICLKFFSRDKNSLMLFPKGPDYSKELKSALKVYGGILKIILEKIEYTTSAGKITELYVIKILHK